MTDIELLIAEGAHRLFADLGARTTVEMMERGEWPATAWTQLVDSGFLDVLMASGTEQETGHWSQAFPVLHAAGLHCVPLPVGEPIIAKALASKAGLGAATGLLTFVHAGPELRAEFRGDRLVLTGHVNAVPWARFAVGMVLSAKIDDATVLALVNLQGPTIELRDGRNAADEPRDAVILKEVEASNWTHLTPDRADDLLNFGALARSAMLVGAAESALSLALQYAGERRQFGRALSQFQAIQQMLAMLAGEVTAAKTVTRAAFDAAAPEPRPFDVAVAKIRAGRAAGLAASIAHQVHGAIGFAAEHNLQLRTRRLWSWRSEDGAESDWAERLGRTAIEGGGASFWRYLTAEQAARKGLEV